jgi:hypothetical protein
VRRWPGPTGMRCLICVLVVALGGTTALADPLAIRRLREEDAGPQLVIDPVLMRDLSNLGGHRTRERVRYQLGPLTFTGEAETWQVDDHTPETPPIDLPGRGWSLGTRFAAQLPGGLTLEGVASIQRDDSAYGSGTHRDLGLAIRKAHRFSRWTTAWIQLGIGRRTWSGQPPAGEKNATTVGISIGGTFK